MMRSVMMPTVVVIPATRRSIQNGGQLREQTNVRVAAYCRVSTGDESQQTSYAAQKSFYTRLITEKTGWKFAGIYADEALSGTSRIRRAEFNRMMEDAKAGKLDYIVSKSISRFARNTVDTLTCIRELRQLDPPVGVFFEKENIDTLDAKGELILTILSALAQDESRSISDNIRWAFQKKFQAGQPQINLNRMLGYEKGEDGTWKIHAEQAEIVQYMFQRFASGQSANKIATELNALGKTTVNGKQWAAGSVLVILRNEKYAGDLEMQKTVTKDFLTHRSVENKGEAPRYYVKNHHEAIIDRMTWEKVQAILGQKRKVSSENRKEGRAGKASTFGNLQCGALQNHGEPCGESFFRLIYTGTAKGYTDERSLKACGMDQGAYKEIYSYAYPIWRCRGKKEKGTCPSVNYHECALEQSFMEMLYRLKKDFEKCGERSFVHRAFAETTANISKRTKGAVIASKRLKLIEEQIEELKIRIEDEKNIRKSLEEQLASLYKTKDILEREQGELAVLKKNFDFFIACLKQLPMINEKGTPLRIYSLDKEEDGPMDMLPFEKGIYCAFIEKGIVSGDTIQYKTNFGVTLNSFDNCRTLHSFLGFRLQTKTGATKLIESPWQVYDFSIQYKRMPKSSTEKRKVKLKNKTLL